MVVRDVVDAESWFELRPGHAPNIVIGLAHLAGRAVGIVANQPAARAGALDIDASRKAARFVQWCDAFNFPIVTFVDTPGFEPGKDLEWRGMIRHGAQLVHAYAEATVPRLCVVLRKAYGGAYIVMDSRRLGNDYCVAWPGAEIAVMGAGGAVQILHSKRLSGIDEPAARAEEHDRLLAEYEARFGNPYAAAERGFVDTVIDPLDTRRVLVGALEPLPPEAQGCAGAPPLEHPAVRLVQGEMRRRGPQARRRRVVSRRGFMCSSIAAICWWTRLMACSGLIITRNSTIRPSSLQRMMSTPLTYLPSTVVSNSSTAVSPAITCFV